MNAFRFVAGYLAFLARARSYRGIHSPFLFRILKAASAPPPVPSRLRTLRKRLYRDRRPLSPGDPGAGSTRYGKDEITVSRIARHSPMPARRVSFLSALAKEAGVSCILELGTSLGLSALIMEEMAGPDVHVLTIEGNPAVAAIALENVRTHGMGRITPLTGLFDDVLPGILDRKALPGMIILDGDHTLEGTLRYYHAIMDRCREIILVVDDIRWSDGMADAWAAISGDSLPKVCLDFYTFGLVIRSEGLTSQYFRIRF